MASNAQKQGRTIEYLRRNSDRPVPAIELAQMLRIDGDRESKRRALRAVITDLRNDGYRVCAGHDEHGNGGYWLAASHAEWAEYLAAVKAKAKYTFALVRKRQEAVIDRESGQGKLFSDEGRAMQWA